MDITKENKRKTIEKKIPADIKLSKFSLKGNEIWARCLSVYDGDTIRVGFFINGSPFKFTLRLSGLDTPEIRSKDPEEKVKGYAARDYLRELIHGKTVFLKLGKNDKYGRLLAEIYFSDNENEKSINNQMIEMGHGYYYDGGAKKR